jgi:formate-nitrite transporter family protein
VSDASSVPSEEPPAEPEPKKPSQEILRDELREALAAFARPRSRLFLSGIAAGLEVGFSMFLIGVMITTTTGQLPQPVVALLVANMYSMGFILVVVGRSELFTEQTTLAVLPVLDGRKSIQSLLELWGIVYGANMLGAAVIAGMIVLTGPPLGVVDPQVFGEVAGKITGHSAGVIVLSGILAGWLMGLLSWLVAAGRETVSQIVIVWLITTSIGLGHLHHCVLGTVEVLCAVYVGSATPAEFAHFLVWATLGNTIGGSVFVSLVKYSHARPESPE